MGPQNAKRQTFIGDTKCTFETWISDSAVACAVAPGIGAGLSVRILAGNQEGVFGGGFVGYDVPVIKVLSPRVLPRQVCMYACMYVCIYVYICIYV